MKGQSTTASNNPGSIPANAATSMSPGPVGPMPQPNGNMAAMGRGNTGPALNANVGGYGNPNNSIMDNSNVNLLDQSRNNASQPPVYDYGRNFNNTSFRA